MKKEIKVTPEQMTKAINDVVTGERMKPIMEKAPVVSMAFMLFGAELMRILFDVKEDKK